MNGNQMTDYVQASEESAPIGTDLAPIGPDAAPAISPTASSENPSETNLVERSDAAPAISPTASSESPSETNLVERSYQPASPLEAAATSPTASTESPSETNLLERSYQPASPLEAAADRIQAMTRFIQINSPRLMTSAPGRQVVAGWYQTLRLEKAAFKENLLAQRDANAATQLAAMMPQLTEAGLLAVPTGGGKHQIVRVGPIKPVVQPGETWAEYASKHAPAAEARANQRAEAILRATGREPRPGFVEKLAESILWRWYSGEATTNPPPRQRPGATNAPLASPVAIPGPTNAPTQGETWAFRDGKYVRVK